jgi:hypothetical protein
MSAQLAGQPQDVWPKLTSAVSASGASVTKADSAAGVIEATVGVSIWSWGEKMLITVVPKDGGSFVTVESKSRVPLTLFDWGKNKRNVEKLLAQLSATGAGT